MKHKLHRRPFRARLSRGDFDHTLFQCYQLLGAVLHDLPDADWKIMDNLADLMNGRVPPHGEDALRTGTWHNQRLLSREDTPDAE